MDFYNIVFLILAAIVIAIIIVMQFRCPTMPLVNFFATIISIVILTIITLSDITLGWYVTIVFVILLTIPAMSMNKK